MILASPNNNYKLKMNLKQIDWNELANYKKYWSHTRSRYLQNY